MALIHRVNWNSLDRVVVRQQRNRSAHVPAISFYRWWARRPHSFARAVLDAAQKQFRRESFLVSDPFSGGGTVAFEATRRGLPRYAQDLYPWPSQSLATALMPAAPDEFKTAAAVLEALSLCAVSLPCVASAGFASVATFGGGASSPGSRGSGCTSDRQSGSPRTASLQRRSCYWPASHTRFRRMP